MISIKFDSAVSNALFKIFPVQMLNSVTLYFRFNNVVLVEESEIIDSSVLLIIITGDTGAGEYGL